MNLDEVIINSFEEAENVWHLISTVAKESLFFPEKAINHFRQGFTNEELIYRSQEVNIPFYVMCINIKITGVLIGTAPEGGVGTIIWLIVAPENQGIGIGTILFEKACKCYRKLGCHKIKLTASTSEAVEFYKKNGMKVEGFHENHWWNLNFWSLGKSL